MYMSATKPRDRYVLDLELNVSVSPMTDTHITREPRLIRLYSQSINDVVERSYGMTMSYFITSQLTLSSKF